ncbi:superoxide dismutase [Aquibacillus kalidii]|uniref:superoxide dismutase n=1 Tax=Aquibacillus kalidii TaxID=2762597 RepID=UPI0016449F8C
MEKNYLQNLINWYEEVEKQLQFTNHELGDYREQKEKLEYWLGSERNLQEETLRELQEEAEFIREQVLSMLNESRHVTGIPVGAHKLPPLPYAYNALEPYISEEIMRLHHDKHHRSYVEGLNRAEKELYVNKLDDKLIKHWMREQAFNGSGHYLHTIFWSNMTPTSKKKPGGQLAEQIKRDFGSFQKFKRLFTKAAESVEGVGWAIVVWEPRAGRLGIQTVEKHQNFSLWDTIPLLVIDVWEHAYYLQYQNNRTNYIENWWNVVNWDNVEKRFDTAKQVMWKLS